MRKVVFSLLLLPQAAAGQSQADPEPKQPSSVGGSPEVGNPTTEESPVGDGSPVEEPSPAQLSPAEGESSAEEGPAERESFVEEARAVQVEDSPAAGKKRANRISGSVTLSSFYYSESGEPSDRGVNDGFPAQSASAVDRLFTEIRIKLKANRLRGRELAAKLDFRYRRQFSRCDPRTIDDVVIAECPTSQSGTFGGDELDLKEVFLRYRRSRYELTLGRQIMPHMHAFKFDGLQLTRSTKSDWRLYALAGLYPDRGSRDMRSDYPRYPLDPADPDGEASRLFPLVMATGGGYGGEKISGSVGIAGVLPLAKEYETGRSEANRLMLTANGHWHPNTKTDIYHYFIINLAGGGSPVSNASLGANYRVRPGVNLFARANRVDTEILNVQAQLRLNQVDGNPMTIDRIQNNWFVSRVSQESLEAGASSAFKQRRYELSGSAKLRTRPKLQLRQNDGTVLLLGRSQALDMSLRFLDRRSIGGFRFSASVTRSGGYGDKNLDRSRAVSARVDAKHSFAGSKGLIEVSLNFIRASDETLMQNCGFAVVDFEACYGSSDTQIASADTIVFYSPTRNWLATAIAGIGRQELTTSEGTESRMDQPAVLMLSTYLRLAYRF